MSDTPRRYSLLQDSTAMVIAAVTLGGMLLAGLHNVFDRRGWHSEYGWPLYFLHERQDGSELDPGAMILDIFSWMFLCCAALFILKWWRERQLGVRKGRRWFQIHLVTAMIVMIAAGLVLPPYVLLFNDFDTMPHDAFEIVLITFFMFIAMLITVAAFCEWRIRRREARKP